MDLLLRLLKHVDVKGLVKDELLHGLLFPKLDELVAATDNKLDDAMIGLVKQALESAIDELLAKLPK